MRESGFLKFKSLKERDEFAQQLLAQMPSIKEKCFISRLKPHIIVENLTPHEQDELLGRLDPHVAWMDDVTFE